MRIIQSFDDNSRSRVQTLEVGEIEDFAFNLTTRVGQAEIVSASFTLRLTPFSAGADLNPSSRLSNQGVSNKGLYYRTENDVLLKMDGYFAIVRVGPLPASAAGGTYMLGYQTFLDDGRIIQGSANVQCMLPGGQ